MFPEARRNFIIEILLKNKKAMVSELAKTLKVSEETVRRDLTTLEKQGLIVKSYGGAILKGNPGSTFDMITDISERKDTNLAIKDLIAGRAAEGPRRPGHPSGRRLHHRAHDQISQPSQKPHHHHHQY